MKVKFRPATPDDAEAAVPCIYSSGPAAFDHIFSHRTRINAHEFLRQAFIQGESEFGYKNHVVGEYEGRVVAAGAGFTGEDAETFFGPMLKSFIRGYGLIQTIGVIRRGMKIEKAIPPPKGRDFCISHLGVVPDARGLGAGSQLIEHLLNIAAERELETAFLDVSVENPKAQALYERFGFEVMWERESKMENSTARVPDHRRMVRPVRLER